MGRYRRGWALAKHSWGVVKADRSLVVFPIISAIAGIVTAAVFFGAGAGIIAGTRADWIGIVLAVIGVYLLIAIGIFCGVALSACAARALEGHDTTVGEGIAAASKRRGLIFEWAGVQLVVGGLISVAEALLRQVGGALIAAIFGGLANFAWAVATFFVVPVIAFEDLSPRDAIKRSSGIVRERWGEGVTGAFAIGAVAFLVGILPAAILIVVGSAISGSAPAFGAVLVVLGAVFLVVVILVQVTISTVFKVALYRFATDGSVLAGFEQQELEAAFKPKRRRL
jgi:Family of unknown function (DUF6159)/Protein of unknown function (DUF4013)